jgi:hypothetical protein
LYDSDKRNTFQWSASAYKVTAKDLTWSLSVSEIIRNETYLKVRRMKKRILKNCKKKRYFREKSHMHVLFDMSVQ